MRTLISFMVMRTGFEPVNAALRGQCVKPLHQRTRNGTYVPFSYALSAFLAVFANSWNAFSS